MKMIDNRQVVTEKAWAFYPTGEFKAWGNEGFDTRRDFMERTFNRAGMEITEWTEGTIVRTREEIQELMDMGNNPESRAKFVRNRYR